MRWLYDKFIRKVDDEIQSFIKHLKKFDIKVFIVTGNTQGYQTALEKWFKKHGVIYDKLYCYHSNCGLTIAQWKTRMAKKLEVDYFIEDLPDIADYLRTNQVKVILYNGKNTDELWQLNKGSISVLN